MVYNEKQMGRLLSVDAPVYTLHDKIPLIHSPSKSLTSFQSPCSLIAFKVRAIVSCSSCSVVGEGSACAVLAFVETTKGVRVCFGGMRMSWETSSCVCVCARAREKHFGVS